jgi:ElaB/YqjD/DUF883 family membrane-anchored ribosome-binding protein
MSNPNFPNNGDTMGATNTGMTNTGAKVENAVDKAKNDAASTIDNVQNKASNVVADAKDKAADIKDQASDVAAKVKDQASNIASDVSDAARKAAEAGKVRAASAVESLSTAARDAATTIDDKFGEKYGDYARKASDSAANVADALKNKNVDELVSDARSYVKSNPGVAIGAAAAVGFLLTRLFRAGGSNRA